MSNQNRFSTRTLALSSILMAIVIILQFMGAFIRFGPFSISLTMVPIIIGAATCGTWAGAWLGLVFGIVVLLSGDAGAFLAVNVPGTIITVLLKGVLCGTFAAIAYNLLKKVNKTFATVISAIVCPIVNTGVFLIGCKIFFWDTILQWASSAGFQKAAEYMVFGLVGGNFIVEMLINILLCPVIIMILNIKRIR